MRWSNRRGGMSCRRGISLLMVLVLSCAAGSGRAAIEIGVADIIVGDVYGRNLQKRMTAGEKLIYNQKVRTGTASAATLEFADRTKMTMGERAEMLLDDLVYDPKDAKLNGVVQLTRGVLRFASEQQAKVELRVRTPAATIGIRGTAFDVFADPRRTEVTVIVGRIQVSSQFGSQEVGPGQTYSVNSAAGATFAQQQSSEMAQAIATMLSMISADKTGAPQRAQAAPQSQQAQQTTSATPQVAAAPPGRQPEAFYHAIRGKDLENLIYVDTKYGRLVIELLPDRAPTHVARMKELSRDGFYDGLTFHRVQKGFVAETGDPTGSGMGGSGKTLKAELSKEEFVRGVVGMKHRLNELDTADSQFFILSGAAPHLNGKYTIWGRVIYGMEFVDLLQPGSPPKEPDTIIRMRVAADVKDS